MPTSKSRKRKPPSIVQRPAQFAVVRSVAVIFDTPGRLRRAGAGLIGPFHRAAEGRATIAAHRIYKTSFASGHRAFEPQGSRSQVARCRDVGMPEKIADVMELSAGLQHSKGELTT